MLATLLALLPLLLANPSGRMSIPGQQKAFAWVEDLDLGNVLQDFGEPHAARSVNGTPISIGQKRFDHGLGTEANSSLLIDLHRSATEFLADVGVDDEVGKAGIVRFFAYVDGRLAADTGIMHGGDPARPIDASLNGASRLELVVEAGGSSIEDYHADWGDARIILKGAGSPRPVSIRPKSESPIRIDMGGHDRPEINGPRVVGCSPNTPFIFKIPASGKGPLQYSADNLPAGLSVDPASGIATGTVTAAGTYPVAIRVSGPGGSDERNLTIICGQDMLARTPPMGWNSWNAWGISVTQDEVRAAADSFIRDRLIDYGYRYVNIDDSWEGQRDGKGNIQPNSKFSDIPGLAQYLHSKGLLIGIYSSPGPKTCDGYEASYGHEQEDANTYAKWGIDYLKYDWCTYYDITGGSPTLTQLQQPYIKMHTCLDRCGRDIVFSICQYGMGDVWKWGRTVGGNLWRTTYDIVDSYWRMSTIGFAQGEHASYAGPGGWNDPDMLVVGNLGWGAQTHPTRLSPNEQITHITLWALLAAPFILGCDLDHLDPWTKALVTNHDVVDVDQDPLGRPAQRVFATTDGAEVWSRPLWDGTIAVGLMNRSRSSMKISVSWDQLHLTGPQPVRDLWERRSIGIITQGLTAEVPMHGARMYKIGAPVR